MIALGVLLLALAVLVGVVVSLEATESVSINVLGWNLATDGVGAFWIGAGSMLVAVVALALIARGTRRGYQVRKENRQLRKEQRRMETQRAQDAPRPAYSEPAEPPTDEDPHRPPPPAGT